MINPSDLHTYAESRGIEINNVPIGTLLAEYEVRAYQDLRNMEMCRSYIVSARMRLILANNYRYLPSANDSFAKYPAAFYNSLALKQKSDAGSYSVELFLLDYFPQTINSEINASKSDSATTGQSQSSQRTAGSSVSDTNTYEVSANIGFFGKILTGGASGGLSKSTTTSSSIEDTAGTSQSRDNQSSLSASMSVKDWAVYAQLDKKNAEVTWLWGQEYPWNVLEYCGLSSKSSDGSVDLPEYVRNRLQYKTLANVMRLAPPSQLSLHGVNFCANGQWLVRVGKGTGSDEVLTFEHELKYFTATHSIDGNELTAKLHDEGAPFKHESPELNLALLGLDPIIGAGLGNGAITGFSPQEVIARGAVLERFRAISSTNNLYVAGTGFIVPSKQDELLRANLRKGSPAHVEVKFKLIDLDRPLALYLKHWKLSDRGCVLRIEINDGSRIVRTVNSFDNGDGSNNITSVILLQKDYNNEGYFNYVKPGLNTISISFEPEEGAMASSDCQYVLRAVAIG